VLALAFTPDGKHLATAGGIFLVKGEIRVWDPALGKEVGKSISGSAGYAWVGFSSDSKRLFAADYSLGGGLLGLRFDQGRFTYSAWDRASGRLLEQVSMPNKLEPIAADLANYVHAASGRLLIVEGKQARVVVLGEKRAVGGPPWQHDADIWYARLSPDGRFAVTYSPDRMTRVRDLELGREFAFSTGHGYAANGAAFPAEDEVALTFYDGTARRYSLLSRRPISGGVDRLGTRDWRTQFSDDGGFLVGATSEGKARVWLAPGWQAASPWLPHGAAVSAGLLARGGRWLVTGTADGTVRVWNLARSEGGVVMIGGTPARPAEVSFDAAGRGIVVGGGSTYQIDLPPRGAVYSVVGEPNARATAVSPAGKLLAVGTSRGLVRLVNRGTGKDARAPLAAGARFVHDVHFSPDGSWFATRAANSESIPGSFLGVARAFDTASGKELARVTVGGSFLSLGGVTSIAVSPEGRFLAAGVASASVGRKVASSKGEVRLVEPRTGKTARVLKSKTGMVPIHLAFAPAGRRLAVAAAVVPTGSSEVSVWDYAGSKELFPPIRLPARVNDQAFDPGGRRLAIAAGNEVQVWDVVEGRPLFRLPHGGAVTAVRYTGGGRVLAGVAEQEVATWDAETGESLGPPVRFAARVFTAGVSPDGRWLLALSDRRELYFTDLTGGVTSARELTRLARLVSGQTVVRTVMSNVPPDVLEADWREVRRSDPGQLTSTSGMRSHWHWSHVGPLTAAGAWRAALRQYEQVESEKDNGQRFDYEVGTCLLAAGDRERLRRRCLAMLRRAAKTKAAHDIELAVKLSLLKPGTLEDIRPVLELARGQGKVDEKDPLWPWFVLAEGLTHYRAGRLDNAANCLERVRQGRGRMSDAGTVAGLVLALTRARQGKQEEGRRLLAEVDRTLVAGGPIAWIERVHAKALREEARAVVEGRGKK
jgi:WD40 repeat protein